MRGWKLYPNKTQAEVPPEVSPLPILWKEPYFLLGIGKPWVTQHTEWTVPRWIGNKRKQWKGNMSLSLLHVEVRHPSCLPLQAPTGQNCLMSPSASTFSEENHHGRTLMESRAETRPCFRLQVISPKLKLAHQRQRVSNFCEVQVPGSGNPTCERSGLRTSFGHPHQAPVTRSSHQTSSSQIYPSHLLCGF